VAGLALVASGCTSSPPDERERVTGEQADELLGQVGVQETLVAAYTAAGAADPALAGEVAGLAAQAGEQLERLRDAAPGATPSSTSPGTPPSPMGARPWLREQVAAAATSHATACVNQSGARAALLGSISAGLRGQDGRLA
jgi:hypothetical protein